MLPSQRFWEIDFLRGIAIVMMVASNFVTDLVYFGAYQQSAFWWWFARATASLFILLAGVSLYLMSAKYAKQELRARTLRRGARIFGYGLLITLVTLVLLRQGFIVFGVLHFIGVATLLAYPLVKHRYIPLVLGVLALLLGVYLQQLSFDFYWLLWLGFVPQGFYSLDYFPLLPWFGVMLLGVFLGNVLYHKRKRRFAITEISNAPVLFLGFLGRHSLLIYLLHQPIILALLYAAGIIPLGALR